MINIAYIVSTLVKAGPNIQLFYIVSNLNKEKFKPIVFTLSPEPSSSLINDFRSNGINIVQLNINKYIGMIFAKDQINKTLERYNIDIIQSYGPRGDYLASISKYKKITTIRNRPSFNYKMMCGPVLGNLLNIWHLHLVKKFDYIVSCSHSIRKYIKYYGINSITISNGIDINKYTPINSSTEKIFIRNNLGLPLDKKLFLTVSNKIPGKNVDFLVKCFSILPILNNHHLLIAGYCPIKTKNRYKDDSNIHFLGISNNLIDYLKACDFFISASYSEGLSNVILESLLVGTPAILSDIPSHREIIGNDQCGILFENNNILSLINSISKIVCMNHDNISKNGIKHIKNIYNAKIMADQYEKIYSSR